jgi:hypothetical protein
MRVNIWVVLTILIVRGASLPAVASRRRCLVLLVSVPGLNLLLLLHYGLGLFDCY